MSKEEVHGPYYVADGHHTGNHQDCSPFACTVASRREGNPLPPDHYRGHHEYCGFDKCGSAQDLFDEEMAWEAYDAVMEE